MRWLQQAVRGCGNLPHVGPHPGTSTLCVFVAMGALAGMEAGWVGVIGGASLMLVTMGSIYIFGAIDRANLSDERGRRR